MAVGTHVSTAWPRNFRPTPNNFGALFNTLESAIGNGGITLVGTATTTVYIGVPASRTWSVESSQMQGNIGAGSSTTVLTAQLIRHSLSGAADSTLTAAQSILAAAISSDCADWPITAVGAARTGQPGDTLRWEVVATGTIGTVPTLIGVVEIAIQY